MSDEISKIKDLAKRFTPEKIEAYITQQIATGQNICLTDANCEKIINEPSKADEARAV